MKKKPPEVFIVNTSTGKEIPINDYIVAAKNTSHNDRVYGRKKK